GFAAVPAGLALARQAHARAGLHARRDACLDASLADLQRPFRAVQGFGQCDFQFVLQVSSTSWPWRAARTAGLCTPAAERALEEIREGALAAKEVFEVFRRAVLD